MSQPRVTLLRIHPATGEHLKLACPDFLAYTAYRAPESEGPPSLNTGKSRKGLAFYIFKALYSNSIYPQLLSLCLRAGRTSVCPLMKGRSSAEKRMCRWADGGFESVSCLFTDGA